MARPTKAARLESLKTGRPLVDRLVARLILSNHLEAGSVVYWRNDRYAPEETTAGYLNGKDATKDLLRALVDALVALEQLELELEVFSDPGSPKASQRKVATLSQILPLRQQLIPSLEIARRAHLLLWGKNSDADFAPIAKLREMAEYGPEPLRKSRSAHSDDPGEMP